MLATLNDCVSRRVDPINKIVRCHPDSPTALNDCLKMSLNLLATMSLFTESKNTLQAKSTSHIDQQ